MEYGRDYRDFAGHSETRYDGGGHKRIPGRSMSTQQSLTTVVAIEL